MTYLLLDNPNPHGNHFYTSRLQEVQIGVLHTGENLPDWTGPDTSGESLSNYARTTSRSVSWHTTVDSDSIIPLLPYTHTAWHVRNYNSRSVGMEQATQAHRWTDAPGDWVEAIIANAAREVARWYEELNIPPKRISREDVHIGTMGLVAHADLDPDRRSDPGDDYPWEMLLDLTLDVIKGRTLNTPTYPTPSAPQPKDDVTDTLRMGDRGKAVESWQKHLLMWNPDALPNFGADGDFGGETHGATRAFQKWARVHDDGIVGPVTHGAMAQWVNDHWKPSAVRHDLGAYPGRLLTQPPLMRGGDVERWQRGLSHWTPNIVKVDGWYGPVTEDATRLFQRHGGVTVDGVVGPNTWAALKDELA